MGEAKARKNSDPFYGRYRKRGNGLILSSPSIVDGESVKIAPRLDPLELRRALLFWDRLSWPSTAFVGFTESPEVAFLMQEGILERPRIQASGSIALQFSSIIESDFLQRNENEPGAWAISSGEGAIQVRGRTFSEARAIKTKLIKAIPIPLHETPLEEILRFKNKREDELRELMIVIGNFYEEWVNSEDQDHQFHLAASKIDAACTNLIEKMRIERFPFSLSNWSIGYSANIDITRGVIAYLAAKGVGLDSFAEAIGAAASINIGAESGPKQNSNSPFRYAMSISKELGQFKR